VDDADELWAASGCAGLTADGVPTPRRLVHGVLELAGRVDRHGGGVGERFAARGLGVLAQRAELLGLGRSGRVSCGGAARLLAAADGEVALSLARDSDRELVPAWLALAGIESEDEIARVPALTLVAAAAELGLPCGAVGEVIDRRPAIAFRLAGAETPAAPRPAAGARVVNLGALWAAPLAAQLLARMGAEVTTVESTARPDGARATPAFFAALREGVDGVMLDFASDDGRAELAELLARADVVIEGSRPRALRQLGLHAEALAARGPQVWVSITAYGRAEPHAHRVGFGDDAAAAGGLVGVTPGGETVFLADAVADPLTGLTAAATVAELLEQGGRYVVDIALSRVAAAHTPESHTRRATPS